MGYFAVTGGQEAIAASMELLKYHRSGGDSPVDVAALRDRMGLLIDRVMSEAGLYAPDYADILVSDYFPPSILHAVFKLHREGLPLERASAMASLAPAQAVGLGDELGSIEPGKRGDIILVHARDALPVVTSVFIDGAWVSRLAYRSERT